MTSTSLIRSVTRRSLCERHNARSKLTQPKPAHRWSCATSSDRGDAPSEPRLHGMSGKYAAKSLGAAQDIILHHQSLHAGYVSTTQ